LGVVVVPGSALLRWTFGRWSGMEAWMKERSGFEWKDCQRSPCKYLSMFWKVLNKPKRGCRGRALVVLCF
jgi:hypothetical protein